MRGFYFVPIRSDSMLIFLSGNRPLNCFTVGLRSRSRQSKASFTSEIVGSILTVDACDAYVKGVAQRSTESRRFTPVSSHVEC